MQSFTYDALNRLTTASTDGVGEGQYSQSYGYDPATGNLASKSDVGAYSYSPAKPHAVTSAGAMNYQYDANGNMISRNGQPISYDAENHLTAFAGKTWLYDGDGKRVAEINADGTATIFIGNYFEGAYPEPEPPAQPPQPNKVYLPIVLKGGISFEPITARMGTLYYYADGQRIAMKKDGAVYYLYGDQLGSVSAVADANGSQISKTLYHPWGTTRHTQGASPTDYSYTGQMQEGEIYFYNSRWYDPHLGRFMQADTFVPTSQGTQGFDRFAYVNNNPMVYRDENGHWITTLVGGIIGAAIGYGVQVYQNVQSGMEFEDALTTNISAEKILAGAAAGAIAGTLLPVAATAISTTGLFTTGTTTITAACADGDCTNEIRQLTESGLKTVEGVANSELGQTIARQFTHNPDSSIVSIGSYPDYLQVGDGMKYTYFNMTDSAWSTVTKLGTDIYWKGINTAFMNQQITADKQFVTAINMPDIIGVGTRLELSILRSAGFIREVINQYSSYYYTISHLR